MEASKEPRVSLIGAGPGSADLITVGGMKVLQNADVVLYDALIGKELLSLVDEAIPKIYVGKRCGEHSYSQTQINALIVTNALQQGHVVRLKGGHPFVFGRASEEIAYVESYGIPVCIIPGVSSAIAVPGCQGIPMTSRGISSSFWVMTATKKEGTFSHDLKYAAQSSTTMVILMGMRKVEEIVSEVSKYRCSTTPIAIIQNGSLANETVALSTLSKTTELLKQIDNSQAGIIVIGDVVAEHPSFFEEEVQRVLYAGF